VYFANIDPVFLTPITITTHTIAYDIICVSILTTTSTINCQLDICKKNIISYFSLDECNMNACAVYATLHAIDS